MSETVYNEYYVQTGTDGYINKIFGSANDSRPPNAILVRVDVTEVNDFFMTTGNCFQVVDGIASKTRNVATFLADYWATHSREPTQSSASNGVTIDNISISETGKIVIGMTDDTTRESGIIITDAITSSSGLAVSSRAVYEAIGNIETLLAAL